MPLLTDPKPYYTVSSLEKGIAMLELLATRGPLGVSEMARELGQNRSVATRFLSTLRDLGYVARDERAKYRLTTKLFGIGQLAVNGLEIRQLARPIMEELRDRHQETVNLACMEDEELVVIEMMKSPQPLKFDLPIGRRGPAHSTALGKAIMAFRSKSDVNRYLEQHPLRALTLNTLTTSEALFEELQRIRDQRYAFDMEEWTMGLRCVAAPILNFPQKASYAISLAGPTQRMTRKKMERIRDDLVRLTASLSETLGSGPYQA